MKNSKAKRLLAGLSSILIAASALPFSAAAASTVYGDANCDGEVNLADAVFIMQTIANPANYKLSEQGLDNADVNTRGDGITNKDALTIQRYMLGFVKELPESWKEGSGPVDPVTEGTLIHLNGTSITVEGENAVVEGNKVTITHSGSYTVDGTLEDGQIVVNIPDEKADAETVKIFLSGVNITGKSDSPILVQNAKNTSINIVDGTKNYLSDGDEAYSGGGAVIEAKDDITIKGGDEGTGSLEITANTQNGIACNNDIKINGGNLTITTLNKVDKANGINGKKSVTVKSGRIIIDATGDGLKSSKGDVEFSGGATFIKAGNDAVQAETAINISDGELVAGGDRGLTAVTAINITGGSVVATAKDNQADSAIMDGSTQGIKLFNMADCPDSDDGTWKKSNSFGCVGTFEKKYKYVLISDASYTVGSTQTFKNNANDAMVVYGSGSEYRFKQTALVTSYDNVTMSTQDPPAYPDDPQPNAGYHL